MDSTLQIGRCGELLVQYRLLKYGIESAPMTTDVGVDLVAYAPKCKQAVTIQVKTVRREKPAGGKGKALLDWWIRDDSPAELVAFVDLHSESIWMFRHEEVRASRLAKDRPITGPLHFGFYIDPDYVPRSKSYHMSMFENFRMECRIEELFGEPQDSN